MSFQFPSLLDPAFLDHLPKRSASQPDAGQTSQARQVPVMTPAPAPQVRLLALRDEFYRLAGMDDRQAAGLALEGLLNAVFDLFQMAPRAPFRLVGEQIDGSFALDHQTYLLEAKWERQPTSLADLLIFQGKIQAKSTFTRGVFVAISGVTQEARDGFSRGRQPSFIVLDGYDLTAVLEGHVALDALLRAKQRRVAEEGRIAVSVTELFD